MAKGKTKKQNKKNNDKYTKSMGRYYHKKTEINGIVFDSKTESEYYEYLLEEQKLGRVKSFTMQDTFLLQDKFIIVDGKRIDGSHKDFKKYQKQNPGCTIAAIKYKADFCVTYKDGSIKVIDVKGTKTADFKIKEKMFNYMYPQYNGLYCVVKYKGQWMEYNECEKLKKANKK